MADRRLQVFHAVAKHLSFTRAAEALFMTQPAVTFQIKQLEEQLDSRLFDRRHGGIALTAAGELVLDYAAKILALSDEMEARLAELSGEMRGTLLVGASTAIAEFLLPPVLGEFNARHPEVRTRLIVANSAAIENRIAEGSLDVGLVETAAGTAGVESEACCDDELQVACAPDHPLAKEREVTPKALQEYDYISREPGSGTRAATDAYFAAAGIAPESLKTVMELGSLQALKGVVGGGLGFAIVSRHACDKEQQLHTLRTIPLKPRLRRSLYLIYPQGRFRSRMAATFIDFVRHRLRETGQ